MSGSPFHNDALEVWMDGACPICRRSQAWCETRDLDRRLLFRDFRSAADADLPVDLQSHETSMWVRTGDGALHDGFAAWRLIMGELPRWRWLARMTGLPPFRRVGPILYRLVARLRYRIG